MQETDENNFLSDISEESSLSQINPGPESSYVGVQHHVIWQFGNRMLSRVFDSGQ